MLMSR